MTLTLTSNDIIQANNQLDNTGIITIPSQDWNSIVTSVDDQNQEWFNKLYIDVNGASPVIDQMVDIVGIRVPTATGDQDHSFSTFTQATSSDNISVPLNNLFVRLNPFTEDNMNLIRVTVFYNPYVSTSPYPVNSGDFYKLIEVTTGQMQQTMFMTGDLNTARQVFTLNTGTSNNNQVYSDIQILNNEFFNFVTNSQNNP